MFIPVSMKMPSQEPSKFVEDAHVSLEAVLGFFRRLNQSDPRDGYIVETVDQEYYVTRDVYDLLKSLVLKL